MPTPNFILTQDNYYTPQADQIYMSVSQYKNFAGTPGKKGCEFAALEKIFNPVEEPSSTALLVGSYVDAYFEGTLDAFKAEHPELFTKQGTLKADYRRAENIINRINQDALFTAFMSGKKQEIMTVDDLFGSPWKTKMDSYFPGDKIVDLKIMASINEMKYVPGIGKMDFVRYWGYDTQGAVYQKIVEMNTGDKLPFYIAVASKEETPDIQIFHIGQEILDDALVKVEDHMPRIMAVKNGQMEPKRCETCALCRTSRVLTEPVELTDYFADIFSQQANTNGITQVLDLSDMTID